MTGMAICRMAVMQRITGRIGKNGMQKGSMHMNDRKMVLDGMMGLVVGDALGCPVQFLDREELRERGAVTEMEGYGTYNMPPGTWTDDSSMALATLASINERNGIDLRRNGRIFQRQRCLDADSPCLPVFHSEGRYFGCGCPSANPPGNRAYA